MTYRRHPGADLAEAVAGLDAIDVLTALRFDELDCTLEEATVATGYVNEAVANYSRVREENDALRQHVTTCASLLSQAAADLTGGFTHTSETRLMRDIRDTLAAVAALSRKVEGDG